MTNKFQTLQLYNDISYLGDPLYHRVNFSFSVKQSALFSNQALGLIGF
jgi:hypothetical protein